MQPVCPIWIFSRTRCTTRCSIPFWVFFEQRTVSLFCCVAVFLGPYSKREARWVERVPQTTCCSVAFLLQLCIHTAALYCINIWCSVAYANVVSTRYLAFGPAGRRNCQSPLSSFYPRSIEHTAPYPDFIIIERWVQPGWMLYWRITLNVGGCCSHAELWWKKSAHVFKKLACTCTAMHCMSRPIHRFVQGHLLFDS